MPLIYFLDDGKIISHVIANRGGREIGTIDTEINPIGQAHLILQINPVRQAQLILRINPVREKGTVDTDNKFNEREAQLILKIC